MSGPLIENPRKRKRRRRQDKPAVGARLVLDDHVKGDVGILSEDLFRNLFPAQHRDGEETNGTLPTEVHHIVISPKAPFECVDDLSWTVVPVIPSSALAASTIQFSPSSLALQRFAEDIQRISPSKLLSNSRSGIEVLALDVLPLALDTVFVTLEGDLAKRLENGEGTFHGSGARINGHHIRENGAARPEEKLESAIREALSSLKVVHSGDNFSLPLPPHPITHVPLPPAKVTLCEPVAQGILSAKTRIIVTQTHHHSKNARKAHAAPLNRALEQVVEADEDTSNEQFFSAAEDRYKTDAPVETDESTTETETGVSEDDIDDLSDDSMEDMISLQVPVLPASNASGVSTLQPGTPYTITGRHLSGMKSPGSVFSGFTANTARAGGQKGRLFKAQGLMRPLPDELLRPAPQVDEDEEARVYVDVNSLAKIGCFSGDWVRLETAQEPPSNGMGLWSLGSFGHAHDEEGIWRPVKVYSLPEGYSRKQVTKISKDKHDGRSNSFFESQISKPSSPTAYLSPLLLSNLESPPYLRILALKRPLQFGKSAQPKITSSSRPTFTTEVTILRVETPISSERMLSNACFVALKQHFAEKRRIIKSGDLIAIPIDDSLGRTLYTTNTTKEDLILDEGLSNVETHRNSTRKSAVVWFKVGQVVVAKPEGADQDDEDIWGGVASTDASITTMKQVSSVKSRLPPTKDNTWQYYLRLKEIPGSTEDSLASSMLEPRSHHVTRLRRELRGLIAAATSPRAVHLKMEPIAILLISTQRNIGKATIATRACTDIGLQTFPIDAYDILSEGGAGGGDVNTAATLQARADRAMTCGSQYCALLIQHIEALTADRMATVLKDILKDLRVLIATTTEVDKIPDGIRGLFTHELEMTAPDEWEREGILRNIIDDQGVSLAADVDLGAVAVKTAALVAGDLVDVVDRSLVARHTRLEALATAACTPETPITLRDIQVAGGVLGRCLTKSDFDLAVEAARKNFADSIGAPKIPNVGWDDVGGLSNVKDAVMETIQLPLERPELFAKGMKKRSGILFYGPPGTGKTLLAKAIATEFSLNFFSVKGPELLNMYIGESEANVRRVFQRARDARPCVVFFDELDSVAPKRGNQGDSGGVMDRIVSQLLAELDGMSDGEDGGGGVFVIGATNRPDLLDQALLRPGRFDKMLYLGVSDTHEKQATIMEALTRKFTMSPNLSLNRVASQLPFTYTGADFYALCSDAMLKAVTRQALLVDSKIAARNASQDPNELKVTHAYFFDHYATKEDVAVLVTEEDFAEAQKELIPSVSFKELDHYKRVREMFEAAPKKEGNGTEPAKAAGTNGTSAGVPEWQLANRTKPGANATPLQGPSPGMGPGPDSKPGMNARLRSKASSFMARDKGKGKGKARLEEVGSEDDDEQLGSNRSMGGRGSQNGHAPGTNGFRESVDDDEGLY